MPQIQAQKIIPFLWFDNNAEEAARYYISIFKNAEFVNITRYGKAGPGPKGSVMAVTFRLEGQDFYALNGGPEYSFTPAVSFFVNCENQEEIDHYWEKLSTGGKKEPCGWLKDRFGVSWQIVPRVLIAMYQDKDEKKAAGVMKAMLKMGKLDIATLEKVYRG